MHVNRQLWSRGGAAGNEARCWRTTHTRPETVQAFVNAGRTALFGYTAKALVPIRFWLTLQRFPPEIITRRDRRWWYSCDTCPRTCGALVEDRHERASASVQGHLGPLWRRGAARGGRLCYDSNYRNFEN